MTFLVASNFTELIGKLAWGPILREEYSFDNDRFIHDVEWYCRNTEAIKVLDYTMTSLKRAKMFIYTP